MAVAIAGVAPAVAKDRGAYEVRMSGMSVLPATEPVPAGTEKRVAPGELLMSAPLGWFDRATLDAPLTVEISGIPSSLAAGTILYGSTAKGGDLDALAPGSRVYCAPGVPSAEKMIASAMTFGLSTLASRVAQVTQLCLIDSDANARFDRAFLVGLKRAADRKMVGLDAGYKGEQNQPIPGARIDVFYRNGGLLPGVNISTEVTVEGKKLDLLGVAMVLDSGTELYTRLNQTFNGRTLPRAFDVASARVMLTGYDRASKSATFRFDRPFSTARLAFHYRPQAVYIYIPR